MQFNPCQNREAFPDNYSFDDYYDDGHSASWLTVEEMQSHLDDTVEDRRVTINGDGDCTCEPGQGQSMTVREFLGEYTVRWIESLPANGRIVFYFVT